jgi:hypothetical protein
MLNVLVNPKMSRSVKDGYLRAMKCSSEDCGTQKSAAASFATRSSSGMLLPALAQLSSSSISNNAIARPCCRNTCSISCRRTNQKLSMRSSRNDIPITGERSFRQKQTPSTLVDFNDDVTNAALHQDVRHLACSLQRTEQVFEPAYSIQERIRRILCYEHFTGDLSNTAKPCQLCCSRGGDVCLLRGIREDNFVN